MAVKQQMLDELLEYLMPAVKIDVDKKVLEPDRADILNAVRSKYINLFDKDYEHVYEYESSVKLIQDLAFKYKEKLPDILKNMGVSLNYSVSVQSEELLRAIFYALGKDTEKHNLSEKAKREMDLWAYTRFTSDYEKVTNNERVLNSNELSKMVERVVQEFIDEKLPELKDK